MKVSELCDTIADHFSKLYLHKLGKSAILLAAGVLVVVTPTSIAVYELDRRRCDKILAEIMLSDLNRAITNCSPIGRLLMDAISHSVNAKHLANFHIELCDPRSLDRMDALVNRKMQELIDRNQERWALADTK